MTDSDSLRLLGSWLLEARSADELESRIVRFERGGAMVYTIAVDEREIVMQLIWRVEGNDIVTRDSGSGGEVRSRFELISDHELRMTFGGETFTYVRIDAEPS